MKVCVTKDNVTIVDEHSIKIHKGEYNVNKINFNLSEEYTSDLVINAIFSLENGKAYQTSIINNECDIPAEVLSETGIITFGIYAYKISEEDLKLRYSPFPTCFNIINGSYNPTAEESQEITASQFEQYMQTLQDGLNQVQKAITAVNQATTNANELVKEINEHLENGDFDGPEGPQGETGPTGPGVPTGGTTGQVLSKNSDSDYDTIWKDVESGGSNIIELIGTSEEPVLLYNIIDTGIYKITGSYKSTETGYVANNEGSSMMFCVDKNEDGNITQRYWSTNQAFRLYARVGIAFAGGTEALKTTTFDIYTMASNLQTDGASRFVDALSLRNSIGYNNKNSLQTTDKSSLVGAINELKARIDALENPTE